MNSKSIQKIRKKFILIAMLSLFLVMLFSGTLINVTNIFSTRHLVHQTLQYIIDHDGELPSIDEKKASDKTLSNKSIFDEYSPEFHYSTRFFTVIFDEENEVKEIKTRHIAAIDDTAAEQYANLALNKNFRFGRLDYYYYLVDQKSDGSTIVVFLDSTAHIKSNYRILYLSLAICIGGLLVMFILVYFFSYRAIKPEIENAQRQKIFITNASHELKTPLAVIRANTEMEEVLHGETEWTQSTMRQIHRMNGLIEKLVMISRSRELETQNTVANTDVTTVVNKSIDPFISLFKKEEKTLTRDIEEDLSMTADPDAIQQLTSLLMDNAIKYCDEKGLVSVQLSSVKKGKMIRLIISNSYANGANVNYSRFFERFYREDDSHNTDKGGYGIGLSLAESICQQYGGSIKVRWKDGMISFICLLACQIDS